MATDDQAERDQLPEKPTGSVQVRIKAPTDMVGAPSYYSNFVQVGISPYEFTVNFSRLSIPLVAEPPAEPVAFDVTPQPVASVVIPLNLVRGVIRALEGQVENWETTFHQALPAEPPSAQTEPKAEPATAQEVEAQ
jgi:Protein of unknown function (DUF3467)